MSTKNNSQKIKSSIKIFEEKSNKENNRLRLSVEDYDQQNFESFEIWMSNCIKNLKNLLIESKPLMTTQISKNSHNVFVKKINVLLNKFSKSTKPKKTKANFPFDPSILIHIHEVLFPIIEEILILQKEIQNFLKK